MAGSGVPVRAGLSTLDRGAPGSVHGPGEARALVLDENQTALHRIIATLAAAGFSRGDAMDIYLAGTSYARGFALTDLAQAQTATPVDGFDTDRAFERGLDILAAGFEQVRMSPRPEE